MPTIKKHNCRSIVQQTTERTTPSQPTEGTTSSPNNSEDRDAPIAANQFKVVHVHIATHKQLTSLPDEDQQ